LEDEFTDYVRRQFPALGNRVSGKPVAYLDGPGGYQVPERVIKAVENYLVSMNANAGGTFLSSVRSDEMLASSRQAFADFFNCSPEEVVFGANMTTLNFALAQALVREMKAGDRVMITEIDHEANRGPWLEIQEKGIAVDDVAVDIDTCTIDMSDLERKLSGNTKVVAFNYASNAVLDNQ
jgi:selenocysteine lyase/cysteine desulfurase